MVKSLPPLTWFRSFEAAARHLSFTAAAAEIGMTQSAVSQQIKSLETRLGVPLFVRQPRGLTLTDNGRRLLPDVDAALETLSFASDRFEISPATGLLPVAASISLAQWVLAPRLPEFSKLYPDVPVRFLSAIWPDDFQSARADVEIRFGSSKQVGRDAVPLLPHQLVAVKAPFLQKKFDESPLIEAVGTSSGWQAWSEVFGGSPKAKYFSDNYGMALQLAASGVGIALVSEVLASQAIKAGIVERAHPGSIPAQEGYFLWTSPNNSMASRFSEWVQRELTIQDTV